MRRRIVDYFENRYHGHYIDEKKIMTQLSPVLRNDIVDFSCRKLFHNVSTSTVHNDRMLDSILVADECSVWCILLSPNFQRLSNTERWWYANIPLRFPRLWKSFHQVYFLKNTGSTFLRHFSGKLQRQLYQSGDSIVSNGALGSELFFLENGDVAVVLPNGVTIAHLRDGAYFGGWLLRMLSTVTIFVTISYNIFSKKNVKAKRSENSKV